MLYKKVLNVFNNLETMYQNQSQFDNRNDFLKSLIGLNTGESLVPEMILEMEKTTRYLNNHELDELNKLKKKLKYTEDELKKENLRTILSFDSFYKGFEQGLEYSLMSIADIKNIVESRPSKDRYMSIADMIDNFNTLSRIFVTEGFDTYIVPNPNDEITLFLNREDYERTRITKPKEVIDLCKKYFASEQGMIHEGKLLVLPANHSPKIGSRRLNFKDTVNGVKIATISIIDKPAKVTVIQEAV